MEIKIGLDLDDVVFDFMRHFYRWLGYEYTPPTYWDVPFIDDNFHIVKHDPKFWLSMPVNDNIGIEDFKFDFYVTARPIPSEISEQAIGMNKLPTKPVFTVYNESKVNICKELGITHFIDDKPQTVLELDEVGIKSYVWDADCNQTFQWNRRIKHLSEFEL